VEGLNSEAGGKILTDKSPGSGGSHVAPCAGAERGPEDAYFAPLSDLMASIREEATTGCLGLAHFVTNRDEERTQGKIAFTTIRTLCIVD